jgi:phage baseplate assembly protein gpV
MMAEPNNGTGFSGQATPSDFDDEFNASAFHIKSILSSIAGATLVRVVKVSNAGGVAPIGLVNVLPLVNQMDGNWNAVPHGILYQCPYSRIQGGVNAVILDPTVGDIGIAVFCDRDISSGIANASGLVSGTTKNVNPGSRRMYDMSDGIYLFSVFSKTPTQYVQFSSSGINIVSPTAIQFQAPTITLVAPTVAINASTGVTITTPTLQVNGAIVATGNVTAGSIDLETHRHTGVSTGSGTSGGPTG